MDIFPERGPDYSYGRPDIVQEDGGLVNKRAAPFIYGGTPVQADDFMYLTLQSRIKSRSDQNVLNAFIIVAVLLAAGILRILAESEKTRLFLGVFIFFIAAVILIFFNKTLDKKVSAAAEDRQVRFYSYPFCCKEFYKYDSDDSYPTCYANLGGFCVKIKDETRYSQNVTGAVVTVGDKDYFYLLV